MATHELKTDPKAFQSVQSGSKTVEIRKNDRGFKVDDILQLRETFWSAEEMENGKPLEYTGEELDVQVTHIITGYGLKDGYCAMSIWNF